MDIIKVSAHSRSTAVAGAIAGVMRDYRYAEVQAIGASAVNQAIKAVAIAKNYLALDGIHIVCIPEFVDIDIDGQERTAIKLVIEPRSAPPSAGERVQEVVA
ncbi:MAG: stage V sporulation protein S [Chloroflexi bacterium HGW-Chloroflexi-1]|nr:MAG: stage V sporulation protein S [Chloroflexi bacterium HGW-Chloroflexi-1]